MSLSSSIFEQLTNNNWDAVTYASLDGTVQYANAAAERLYGYEPKELIGQHVDVFNAHKGPDTEGIIQSIIESGGWSGELIQKRKDGTTFDALLTVFLIYDENGKPIGYASNSKDVSGRKQLQKALAENEQYLRTLYSHIPHFIYEVDREYRIHYINRISEHYTSSDVIGSKVTEFVPDENKQELEDKIDEVFERGETGSFNTTVQHPNGDIQYFSYTIAPVRTNNMVSSVIGIAEDITEQVKRDNLIKSKKARMEAIINNTESIMFSIDRNFNLIEFNNQLYENSINAYGFEIKEGDSIFKLIAEEEHEKMRQIYNTVLQGKPMRVIDMHRVPTGEHYFENYYNPIREDDAITGIVIYTVNITDRVRQEEQLKQALKEKELLLAEIHHRLKNNLAVISSLLQIQSYKSDSKEVRDILDDSQSKIKTTALVHEMLYENESLVNIKFADYINRLSTEISKSFRPDDKNVELHIHSEPIDMDIQSAIPCGLFLNEAITNAYKHAFNEKDEGKIEVKFTKVGDTLKLAITDDGIGFSSDFDIEDTETTGLTLMKTFAEQLNGTLSLVSNDNTTFELEFTPQD